MLFQTKTVGPDTVTALSKARKARNDLSHEGKHPIEADALSAYDGVCGLLTVALDGERLPLFDLKLLDHALSDPFAQPKRLKGEPTHWMAIPKLPGEEDLKRAEAAQRSERGQGER